MFNFQLLNSPTTSTHQKLFKIFCIESGTFLKENISWMASLKKLKCNSNHKYKNI